jgi:NADH:ubiquinone oxidoreductase subunit 6 (subunit J)
MPFPALFFYLFAGICVAAAVMVVASRNPVHSVLFLILAFANAAGLFILLGAEFLAMILIIVYVGAVLVLFLFVVMMLDVDFAQLRQGFLQYLRLSWPRPLRRAGAGGERVGDRPRRAPGNRHADPADGPHGQY